MEGIVHVASPSLDFQRTSAQGTSSIGYRDDVESVYDFDNIDRIDWSCS